MSSSSTQHEGGGAVSLAEAHARASSVADGLGRVDAPGDSRLVGEAVARARAAADGVASRCRSADTTASEMEGRLQESRRNVDACRGRLRDDCELKRVKSDGLMSLTSELDEARSALEKLKIHQAREREHQDSLLTQKSRISREHELTLLLLQKKLNLLRALTHVLWVPPYDQISGVILPPEGVPVPLSLGSSTSAVTTANKLWDML